MSRRAHINARRTSSLVHPPPVHYFFLPPPAVARSAPETDAIKAQQEWDTTSDPIVVFPAQKYDRGLHGEKSAVASSPEEADNETPRSPSHTHTHIVRIETLKQWHVLEVMLSINKGGEIS